MSHYVLIYDLHPNCDRPALVTAIKEAVDSADLLFDNPNTLVVVVESSRGPIYMYNIAPSAKLGGISKTAVFEMGRRWFGYAAGKTALPCERWLVAHVGTRDDKSRL